MLCPHTARCDTAGDRRFLPQACLRARYRSRPAEDARSMTPFRSLSQPRSNILSRWLEEEEEEAEEEETAADDERQ
ncbi:hypothetical protein EAI_09919 [Harpegnathos saltator]|uniref:Uncharacterized protein n=1 Tax=Harpegnathos saltator TaxID=610380 RepID=E2BEZ1_HARSA|nr:hypothetical protein EAI_09919 [Harpegnathos saltator]